MANLSQCISVECVCFRLTGLCYICMNQNNQNILTIIQYNQKYYFIFFIYPSILKYILFSNKTINVITLKELHFTYNFRTIKLNKLKSYVII